ncbi:fucolectin-1-like [Mytilus trossulus]|uniref:fucolectin-1-like n=1 Tax=Mytilus trossulus TaxID=6551 RepID=UPI0030073A90
MQKVMFIIAYCVCLISACQITISGGKVNTDACKGYEKLESKINKLKDTLTAKLDSSLRILNKVNEQIKDWKPKKSVIKNVALGKRSQQSSWELKTRSWGNYICCATEYANDGNATTFSHTAIQNLPYWWVDLGQLYDLKRIEIINRSDHVGHRLHDVDITVGPYLKEMSLCAHYKGPGKTAEHLVFHCNRQMRGRYVKVAIKAKEYLQLSEVMVFAPEISE